MTSTNDPNQPPPGPGWWISTDGKLYPPELHPSERQPTVIGTPPQSGARTGHDRANPGRRLMIAGALVLAGIVSGGLGYALGVQQGRDDGASAASSAPPTTTPPNTSTTTAPTTLAPPISAEGLGLVSAIVLNQVAGDETATFDRAWDAISAEERAVICGGVDSPEMTTLVASSTAEASNGIVSAAAVQAGLERHCP
jgi:hypothetical protein